MDNDTIAKYYDEFVKEQIESVEVIDIGKKYSS